MWLVVTLNVVLVFGVPALVLYVLTKGIGR